MNMYEVNIKETSFEKMSARDKLKYTDVSMAEKLEQYVGLDGRILEIEPSGYVELDVHNDNSNDSKDYNVFLIVDGEGRAFSTSSPSLIEAFKHIFWTMKEDAPDEPYTITVCMKPSKNRADKGYMSCYIV